jgi:hypothetical protein
MMRSCARLSVVVRALSYAAQNASTSVETTRAVPRRLHKLSDASYRRKRIRALCMLRTRVISPSVLLVTL